MSNVIPISGATAGTAGSPYVNKLTSSNVAAGTSVLSAIAALSPFIPGWCLIVSSVSNAVGYQYSTDNGSSWSGVTSDNGRMVYVDSGTTIRLNVGATTNIFFYPMGR